MHHTAGKIVDCKNVGTFFDHFSYDIVVKSRDCVMQGTVAACVKMIELYATF